MELLISYRPTANLRAVDRARYGRVRNLAISRGCDGSYGEVLALRHARDALPVESGRDFRRLAIEFPHSSEGAR